MKKAVWLILSLLLCAALPARAEPMKVVASFSILGDMVSRIGGDNIALTTLVAPGGDGHVYQPAPSDVQTVSQARLVLVNGLGFEGWMGRLMQSSASRATLVVASNGVKAAKMEDDGKTITDPHAWQDLSNGRLYVANIAKALAAADPLHAADYRTRAEAYDAELAALDGWVKEQLGQVPAAKRKIITTHDAFGYFGRAYGVAFLAPVGISTEAEPKASSMAKLISQIRREKIKALFIENLSNPKLMQVISKETKAPLGGALFSDSLSPPDGPAASYTAMFQHNVPAMVEAMKRN